MANRTVQTTKPGRFTRKDALTPSRNEALAQAAKLLDEVGTLLEPHLEAVAPTVDRRKWLKVRRGAEKHIDAMAALATTMPSLATTTHVEPTVMHDAVAHAAELAPLVARLEELRLRAHDSVSVEIGDAWGQALRVYELARALAKHDPHVASLVRDMVVFLKPRAARKAAVPAAPKPSAA